MNIEELKRLALDSKAWYDAGAVITDPYDTYPCELFDAAVDATVVLELISQIERLTAEAELFAKHVGLKLSHKDALLRECLTVLSASYAEHYDEALELRLEASIKTELGEQT